MAQTVKTLPAMQETHVQSLGLEDPLEKGLATHSSILAWEIPKTEEPGGLLFIGFQRVRHDSATFTHAQRWCLLCGHDLRALESLLPPNTLAKRLST